MAKSVHLIYFFIISFAYVEVSNTRRLPKSKKVTEFTMSRSKEEDEYILQKRRQMECIEEVRVDPDLILKIKRGYWKKNPDPLLKEWALCVLMKAGLMTAEGVYKIDVALDKVPGYDRDIVEANIDACLTSKAIPAPDIAYHFAKCYHQTKANYTIVSVI